MVLVLQSDSGPPIGSGVNVKTWNIFLIDDGLEENHETFRVQLKDPQNSVLGQRTSATVEILDPRRGGFEGSCWSSCSLWASCRTCLEPFQNLFDLNPELRKV